MEKTRGAIYVLGVDPGSTTGLSVVLISGGPHNIWSGEAERDEVKRTLRRRLRWMAQKVRDGEATRAVAVAEKFTINANTARRGQRGSREAMGVIGVLTDEAADAGVELAPLQNKADASRLVNDDVLRGQRLYSPGIHHANDAARHALLWAIKQGLIDNRTLLKRVPE